MAVTDASRVATTGRTAPRARTLSLTSELVALTVRPEPELPFPDYWTLLSDEELDALAARYDAECGDDPLWVFAYGSLIWKPDFDAVDHMRAAAYGWHRSFCLKMEAWRGTPKQPGLMMALERGGRCDGVIYRIRQEDRVTQIRRMFFRELRVHENLHMVRWIPVETAAGKMRVMVFWAGPSGERVANRLPLDEVAWILARARGHAGSCAEYLFNTVAHLEEFGIHDRNLWTLQRLVADEIKAIHGL
ncbi:gamma-glutamylcyclotransferase [Oryzicola mucosus]|uniref:glutathione-specific gamma-glutamylcyclotransferase n=1 Tax=Oryzicola mucosus TaxID=2767425 RepID=A0A8J6PI81_9HYPH|nr:gamma-glutamylcyclotransferase [Oryzicola mucosus]MBD0414558.1 gamma-glutamylcyclotransferase [Oryzicola mucosus]